MKKYELLLNDTIEIGFGDTLYRIRYLIDIPKHYIKAGALGGYIFNESYLSQDINDTSVIDYGAKILSCIHLGKDIYVGEKVHLGYGPWMKNCVTLEDNVHICKGVNIVGDLFLGNGTKINEDVHLNTGLKTGKDVEIGKGAYISSLVTIKDGAKIGKGAKISEGVCIESNVEIEAGCNIRPYTTIRKSMELSIRNYNTINTANYQAKTTNKLETPKYKALLNKGAE